MTPYSTRARKRRHGAVAVTAAAALVLAACGNGGDDTGGNGEEAGNGNGNGEAAGGTVSVYNCEPQEFTPGNSTEVCGSKMLEQLFTGLTEIDYDTYEASPAVATDWESNDDQTE